MKIKLKINEEGAMKNQQRNQSDVRHSNIEFSLTQEDE